MWMWMWHLLLPFRWTRKQWLWVKTIRDMETTLRHCGKHRPIWLRLPCRWCTLRERLRVMAVVILKSARMYCWTWQDIRSCILTTIKSRCSLIKIWRWLLPDFLSRVWSISTLIVHWRKCVKKCRPFTTPMAAIVTVHSIWKRCLNPGILHTEVTKIPVVSSIGNSDWITTVCLISCTA